MSRQRTPHLDMQEELYNAHKRLSYYNAICNPETEQLVSTGIYRKPDKDGYETVYFNYIYRNRFSLCSSLSYRRIKNRIICTKITAYARNNSRQTVCMASTMGEFRDRDFLRKVMRSMNRRALAALAL
jgi:hypothetical protein